MNLKTSIGDKAQCTSISGDEDVPTSLNHMEYWNSTGCRSLSVSIVPTGSCESCDREFLVNNLTLMHTLISSYGGTDCYFMIYLVSLNFAVSLQFVER